jgi:hypothetical protein
MLCAVLISLIQKETLEQMFLGQNILLQPILQDSYLKSKNRDIAQRPAYDIEESLPSRAENIKRLLKDAAGGSAIPTFGDEPSEEPPTKRMRKDTPLPEPNHCDWCSEMSALIPNSTTLAKIIDVYFTNIHPWIPMLNETTFRENLSKPATNSRLEIILVAMSLTCYRFIPELLDRDSRIQANWASHCKKSVLLAGMERFSVEHLQALIILTFDSVGDILLRRGFWNDQTDRWNRSAVDEVHLLGTQLALWPGT